MSNDPYYLASENAIAQLDLVAHYGSTQVTKVRRLQSQYDSQYEARNYDDRLRSVFGSWDVEVRGMTLEAATQLDDFLNARRGEKPFKWDDGESGSVGGAPSSGIFSSDCSLSEGDGSGDRTLHYYRCKEWEFEYLLDDTDTQGCVNFTATFEQCYGIYTIAQPVPTNLKAIYASSYNGQPYRVYIGGDGRSSDTLIDTLPTGVTDIHVYLSNLGRGANDWIAGVKFRETSGNWTIRNYFGKEPNKNWSITKDNNFLCFYNTRPGFPYYNIVSEHHNQVKVLYWCGHGFWTATRWAFWWNIDSDRYAQIVTWQAYDGNIHMHQSVAGHRVDPNMPQVDLELTFPITPSRTAIFKHRYPEGFNFGTYPYYEGDTFLLSVSQERQNALIGYYSNYPGNSINKLRLVAGSEVQKELTYWYYPIDYFNVDGVGRLTTFHVNDYASGTSDATVSIRRVWYDAAGTLANDQFIYRPLKQLQYYQRTGYTNPSLDVAFFPGDEDFST